MRILFVLESYHPNIGGSETLFKNLVDQLAARDHQIMVITNHPGGPVSSLEIHDKVTIRRYRFLNRYFFTFFAFFPAMLHAFKYDFIQTTSYNAGLPAFLAGLISGRRVCITFHEYWGKLWFELPFFNKWSLGLHFLFEWILVKMPFYRFVAVSDHTRERLLETGIAPRKIVRIYNGIDYSLYKPLDHSVEVSLTEPYTFIYFGRLGISKGLDILLEALRQLKVENPGFRLNLVISTHPRVLYKKVKDLIFEYQLGTHIQLYNHLTQDKLWDLISRSDAVVIPSYNEGFCYTAVESIALAKPVISSGKGALSEVVSGRYLMTDQLTASALCQTMKEAMSGHWQEKPLRKFNLQDTIDQYITLYRQISS
jgi:glycosyltransferase involved in cell wall biosynthesis